MPFKSEAQRKKFYQLAKEGKISQQTLKHWEDSTGNMKLPKRVEKKTSKPKSK